MKGDGDSEMVVFFEDKTMVDGMMNGEPYKAGEFSRSLRYNLFKYENSILTLSYHYIGINCM